MTKTIEVTELTYITGEKYKLPKRTADGYIIYKNGKNSNDDDIDEADRIPVMVPATQVDLFYILPLQLNNVKNLAAQNDSIYAPKLYSALFRYYDKYDNAPLVGRKLELHDKLYDWIQRLLNRTIKASKDRDGNEIPEQTLARRMFGVSDLWFVEQCKDVDTRKKSIDDMPDE